MGCTVLRTPYCMEGVSAVVSTIWGIWYVQRVGGKALMAHVGPTNENNVQRQTTCRLQQVGTAHNAWIVRHTVFRTV